MPLSPGLIRDAGEAIRRAAGGDNENVSNEPDTNIFPDFRYGNYCGENWVGGVDTSGGSQGSFDTEPMNETDAACRAHDLAYTNAKTSAERLAADRKLAEDLGSANPTENHEEMANFVAKTFFEFKVAIYDMTGIDIYPPDSESTIGKDSLIEYMERRESGESASQAQDAVMDQAVKELGEYDWEIIGTDGDDSLRGLSGDDVLYGLGGNDYLEGGAGDDLYVFEGNYGSDTIYDESGTGDASGRPDTVLFKDEKLSDVQAVIETGGDLILETKGGTLTIKNQTPVGVPGERISIFEFQDTEAYWSGGDELNDLASVREAIENGPPITFPIVLDLDRDGALALTGDGQSGWVGPSDGFLAVDRDGSGAIDDQSEIAFTEEDPRARTDLEGLAHGFDSNNDGVVNNQDEHFSELQIFQDIDGNRQSNPSELMSLEEAGIVSIDVSSVPYDGEPEVLAEVKGNQVFGYTDVTYDDGSTIIAGDVALGRDDTSVAHEPSGDAVEQLTADMTSLTVTVDKLVGAIAAMPTQEGYSWRRNDQIDRPTPTLLAA